MALLVIRSRCTAPQLGRGLRALRALLPLVFGLSASACGHQNDIGSQTLVWSAEFDGPAGTLLDDAHWQKEIGRNLDEPKELQYNTNRAENVSLDGAGALAITLRKESYKGAEYTSARLTTEYILEQQYGRFETRVQFPEGQGLSAQLFLLGADYPSVDWPACGDVNLGYYSGDQPAAIQIGAHGPGFEPTSPLDRTYQLPSDTFAAGYHVLTFDWEPDLLRWSVDGQELERATPEDLPSGAVWVFQHPFFIVLDAAIGGPFAGSPDSSTPLPATLKVDYVRVYQP